MPPKLKSFVTESGFFELAVAAPSRAAALHAWGMKHDLFAQGLARQSDDKNVVAATMAQPGTVLRRALGSKASFGVKAELPEVKGGPLKKKHKPAPQKRNDQQEKIAARALHEAEEAYRRRIAALQAELQEVQTRISEVSRAWKEQQKQFKAALQQAKAKA